MEIFSYLTHKGREYARFVLDIVRVYFELLMQQYPTKTSAETCHSGFKCTKDKKNLRHGHLNPPGNLESHA